MLNDFDAYAAALHDGGDLNREAKLLQYLRNFIVQLQSLDEGSAVGKIGYLSNYQVFNTTLDTSNNGVWKDDLSLIAESSLDSCRHIAKHFRSRILRENVMMQSYRARELGQSGIQWIAQRSGRTIREKLAYTHNKMLAVQRRQSIDTGENRLVVAFVRQMVERLDQKELGLTEAEEDFKHWGQRFLSSEDVHDIGRWENAAPNNTLLSDRYYRIVWNQWQSLGTLDDRISRDSRKICKHLALVIFWKLLQEFSIYVRFPLEPVDYDYANFHIELYESKLSFKGLINKTTNDTIHLQVDGDMIYVTRPELPAEITIQCLLDRIVIKVDNEYLNEFESKAGCAQIVARYIVEATFGTMPEAITPLCDSKKFAETKPICIDVFSLHPHYLTEKGKSGALNKRILLQDFGKDIPKMPAGEVHALIASKNCYSVSSALLSDDAASLLSDLIEQIHDAIPVQNAIVPLPDVYNTFQLAPLRQMIHRYYPEIYFSPASIAAAAQFAVAREEVKEGDFLIIASLSASDYLALTVVQAHYSSEVDEEVPDSRGILWERHPTVSYKLHGKHILHSKQMNKTFGRDGLTEEEDRLVFLQEEEPTWYSINIDSTNALYQNSERIETFIDKFQEERKEVFGKNRVRIILLSKYLTTKKNDLFRMDERDVLAGCSRIKKMEDLIDEASERIGKKLPPIWSDHLPSLAIQRMVGEFPLINDHHRIEPVLGIKQEIPINSTFRLPAGKQDYHFMLLMGSGQNAAGEIPYEACLSHNAFPLTEDIDCRLKLIYTYGDDNPYDLAFIPMKETQELPFEEVHVEWKRMKEHPYQDLPSPNFPQDKETWQSLQHGQRFNRREQRMDTSDYLDWVESWFKQTRASTYRIVSSQSICKKYEKTQYNNLINATWLLENGNGHEILKFTIKPEEYDSFNKIGQTEEYISVQVWDNTSKRCIGYVRATDWRETRNGDWMSFVDVDINRKLNHAQLFDNQLLFPLSVSDSWVSFSVNESKNGKVRARDILQENTERITPFYAVKPGWQIGKHRFMDLKKNVFYPLHKIYNDGRSSKSPGCPNHFQSTIWELKQYLPQAFYEAEACDEKEAMALFFRIVCIIAPDMDPTIYDFILRVMQKYPNLLDRDLGCALGDLQSPEQHMLLQAVLSTRVDRKSDKKIIPILGKAVWKNKNFLINLPEEIALEYYHNAIHLVESEVNKLCAKKGKYSWDILRSFEYILAVFRLRQWGSNSAKRQLSLNDEDTSKIPEIIKNFVSTGVPLVKSQLNFSSQEKDEAYKEIPDILYNIMIYVSGGGDEIEIASVSDDAEDDD